MHRFNSTERFTDRVTDYVKYRPSYPPTLIEYLRTAASLGPGRTVADLGSGTGILTRLLLETGARVLGIEPNQAMRVAAERDLKEFPGFTSVAGTGEETSLPDHSVDLVTIAQAFHWMDPLTTRQECQRILKPGGLAAIIWNNSKKEVSAFAREYERMRKAYANSELSEISRYSKGGHEHILMFFDNKPFTKNAFSNHHDLDEAGLVGRFFSASYAPTADSPLRATAHADLRDVFKRHEVNGIVRMEYETEILLGPLT